MARPHKAGIDYFPMDWDFDQDDGIALLESDLNETATLRLIKLWAAIYHGDGYFKMWGDDEARLFAKRKGIPLEDVKLLVETCLKRGLFDRGLFDRDHILTSAGVQKRYLHACENRARITVRGEWLLLDAQEVADLSEKIRKRLILVSAEKTLSESPNGGDNAEKTPGNTGIEPTKDNILIRQQQAKRSYVQDNSPHPGNAVQAAAAVDFSRAEIAEALRQAGVDFTSGKIDEICERLAVAEVDPGFIAFAAEKTAQTPRISNPAGFMLSQLLSSDTWIQAYKAKRRKQERAKRNVPPAKCPSCGEPRGPLFVTDADWAACKSCGGEWHRNGEGWEKVEPEPATLDSSGCNTS